MSATSVFNTDQTVAVFEAVQAKVPSKYIIPWVTRSGEKEFHNVVKALKDKLTELRADSSVRDPTAVFFKDVIHTYHHYKTAMPRVPPQDFVWLGCYLLIRGPDGVGDLQALEPSLRNFNTVAMGIDRASLSEPESAYETWRQDYIQFLSRDKKDLTEIKKNLTFIETKRSEILAQGRPILAQPKVMESRFKFMPSIKGREAPVDKSDGSYIFETSSATQYVPLITYTNNEGQTFYKVHTGTTSLNSLRSHSQTDQVINYDRIANPKGHKVSKNNYIVFTLWLGDPNNEGYSITSSSINTIISVSYKLGLGTMSVRLDRNDNKRITTLADAQARINQAFPILDLSSYLINGYRGSFELWDTQIDEITLIHDLLTNENFLKYFYLDDRKNPPYRTGEYVLRYLSRNVTQQQIKYEVGVKIRITPLVADSDTVVPVFSGNDNKKSRKQTLPEGTQYLQVTITKGIQSSAFNRVMLLLHTLIGYSMSQPQPKGYRRILGYSDLENINYSTRSGNVEFSHANYPDLLPNNYSTLCTYRPIIADPEQEYSYQPPKPRGKASAKSQPQTYEVIGYPLDKPQVYLRSHYPERPYIVIMESQAGIYPCCQSSPTKKITNRDNSEPSTIIEFGMLGSIHASIDNTLKATNLISDPERLRFAKLGLPRKKNSIMMAVVLAQNPKITERQLINRVSEDFARMTDFQLIGSDYVSSTAEGIPLYLSIGKQQLYDIPDRDIVHLIKELEYIDSRLFIRLVQTYYRVNIINFESPAYNQPPQMTTPRCQDFLAYNFQNWPTVLVFSHYGTRLTVSTRPHSELIVIKSTSNIVKQTIFPSKAARILNTITLETNRNLTWIKSDDEMIRYVNPHINVDYQETYGITFLAQIIDGLGRAIVHEFAHPRGHGILVTPPVESNNIPTITNLQRALSLEACLAIFGQPHSCDVRSGSLVGCWYSDLIIKEELFYVSVIPTPWQNRYPRGRYQYYRFSYKSNLYEEFRLARKTNYLIRTLIKWLFQIEFINDQSLTVNEFLDRYVTIMNTDTDNQYNIEKFRSQLPLMTSASEALRWLAQLDPNMVKRSKFAIYTTRYAQDLELALNDYQEILRNSPLEELYHSHENISDFYHPSEEKTPNNIVFSNQDAFNRWMEFQKYISNNKIYSVVPRDLELHVAPYIFVIQEEVQQPTMTYMLIQNVIGETDSDVAKQKAAELGLIWQESRVIDTTVFDNWDPKIQHDFNLSYIDDQGRIRARRVQGRNFPLVIQNRNGSYAAGLILTSNSN
jgi:hypothetical protein